MKKGFRSRLLDLFGGSGAQSEQEKINTIIVGSLQEMPITELLDFCKRKNLDGKLTVSRKLQKGTFFFSYGEMVTVTMNGYSENQAIDAILNWNEGKYVVKPNVVKDEISSRNLLHLDKTVKSYHVLILSNNQLIFKLISKLLLDADHTVNHVTGVQAALESVETRKPHILLVDHSVPDAHGSDHIRMLRGASKTPIIIMVDQEHNKEYKKLARSYSNIYLTRNIDATEVIRSLKIIFKQFAAF